MREVPVNMVGSSSFGRYPKISVDKTYNFFISDGFLVNYPGYKAVCEINPTATGRGIFNSTRGNFLLIVMFNNVYRVNSDLSFSQVATISTYEGNIFMDENEKQEIAICDQSNIYIYNYNTGNFNKAATDFIPNYICYQDGRFIAGVKDQPIWRLGSVENSLIWTGTNTFTGTFQTKGDTVNAVIPVPGAGSLLYVVGNRVAESWYDVGAQLFPYQKTTSYNIDYGCVSSASIAHLDNVVVWLSKNSQAGPAIIVVYPGTPPQQISTDGIDYLLDNLQHPELAHGSLFRQDGHLFYQLTFPSPEDNLSIVYDFNTQKFFHVTDENLNYHIARRIVYFNDSYYFISFNDGNLYQFSSAIFNLNGNICERVRTCGHIRQDNALPFILRDIKVTMEQGWNADKGRVDIAFSLDGGQTFGNYYSIDLNNQGYLQNILQVYFNGWGNDFVPQFRFWGNGRFVVGNAIATLEAA